MYKITTPLPKQEEKRLVLLTMEEGMDLNSINEEIKELERSYDKLYEELQSLFSCNSKSLRITAITTELTLIDEKIIGLRESKKA